MTQKLNYDFLPAISGPYVHAAKHNKTLYISGLTAFGTEAQTRGLVEQSAEVLNQIGRILDHERCTKSDLIKLTIFVTDINLLPAIREQLFVFYAGQLPACSLIEVSKLIHDDLKIEIEATVALSD
ncbi:MAG: RidA family protein [Vibrio sp.]|uniref:RidA family protein n=1 Tax=Vibrio TaxID=662 RepID=UPI001EC6E029|nr:RidA family protein [Vibrio sp.]NRB68375.1 RidA family protein [Vibrio sp.]